MPKSDLMRKHLLIEGTIDKPCLVRILNEVTALFGKFTLINTHTHKIVVAKEPNLLRVEEPVIIVGDIHGQYFDMIHMFKKVIDKKGLPK